jgi:hypothetical protein
MGISSELRILRFFEKYGLDGSSGIFLTGEMEGYFTIPRLCGKIRSMGLRLDGCASSTLQRSEAPPWQAGFSIA